MHRYMYPLLRDLGASSQHSVLLIDNVFSVRVYEPNPGRLLRSLAPFARQVDLPACLLPKLLELPGFTVRMLQGDIK